MVTKKHKKQAAVASYNTCSSGMNDPPPKSYADVAARMNAFSSLDDNDLSNMFDTTTYQDDPHDPPTKYFPTASHPSSGDITYSDPLGIQKQLAGILKVLSFHTTCLKD